MRRLCPSPGLPATLWICDRWANLRCQSEAPPSLLSQMDLTGPDEVDGLGCRGRSALARIDIEETRPF